MKLFMLIQYNFEKFKTMPLKYMLLLK